jgi:hypothetical protein
MKCNQWIRNAHYGWNCPRTAPSNDDCAFAFDEVFREIPRSRVLKLRIRDDPNPLRERGIVLLRLTQCLGKSLADAF